MSKYTKFDFTHNTLVYTDGDYAVYASPQNIGRWYLVSSGMKLAFKNVSDTEIDCTKWIESWESNAHKQLEAIEVRKQNLQNEYDEVWNLLNP